MLLPPEQTIVEMFYTYTCQLLCWPLAVCDVMPDQCSFVLETVEPESRVVAGCKQLKEAEYQIALDDRTKRPARRFADLAREPHIG